MSLQQLVNHFNNNFEKEHQCDFRPFILRNNKVTGVFGIAHIKTELTPIRFLSNSDLIAGYVAEAVASTDEVRNVKTAKIKKLLAKTLNKPVHVPSIVSFDRLCRTVHLLNYLALATRDNFLITEVDPRHILGLPYNHGIYFEQIILHAGLKTQDVVISMTIHGVHTLHYPKLLQGLNNYRRCGYRIALNLGYFISADKAVDFIEKLAPNYVIITAPYENYLELSLNSILLNSLNHLKELVSGLGGKMIMQQVEQPEQVLLAKMTDIDFIAGDYYQEFSWPHLQINKLKQSIADYECVA